MSDMKTYLPPRLREIKELEALCLVNDPDKDEIFGDMDDDTDDFYITSATPEGLARWERIMGIVPPSDASITDRQFALMSRVNNRAPFTEERIKGMIGNLVGADNFDFEMTLNAMTLHVKLHLGTRYKLGSLTEMMENVVPAHINLIVDLKYNTHQLLNEYTHQELSAYTHTQLKEQILE